MRGRHGRLRVERGVTARRPERADEKRGELALTRAAAVAPQGLPRAREVKQVFRHHRM